ncbi:MAG: hypothetical protein J2P21_09210 [Chloracidobacterium sp.]|nr:hypothetical protein [Chloracidobacterium sp.]
MSNSVSVNGGGLGRRAQLCVELGGTKLPSCFQIMKRDNPESLRDWMSLSDDLLDFEASPVMTSLEAAEAIAPRL